MGRPAAKIGTVAIHKEKGRRFRAIKVLDAQQRPYWRPYAAHLWELHHGPVPRGRRVVHADGNPLNDAIDNLILGRPGDELFLALEDDAVAARRDERVKVANAQRNREVAALRRAFAILRSEFYLVIHSKRFVLPRPFRTIGSLAAEFGLPADRAGLARIRESGIIPTLGRDVPTEGYARVEQAEAIAALREVFPDARVAAA